MLQRRAFILKGARLFGGIVRQGDLIQQPALYTRGNMSTSSETPAWFKISYLLANGAVISSLYSINSLCVGAGYLQLLQGFSVSAGLVS